MLGQIVVQRSDERRIDWNTRHRTGVLDLHLDAGSSSRQATQGDRKAVGAKGPPDFYASQQALSAYWDAVAIVEFTAPTKHATGQIP